MPSPRADVLQNPYNLRMVLQLGKDFLAQTGGDLRVNPRVLNILVAQMVGHVLNALACFSVVVCIPESMSLDSAKTPNVGWPCNLTQEVPHEGSGHRGIKEAYGCAYQLAGSTTRSTRRDHSGRGQRHLSQRLAHLDRGLGLDRPTIATAQGHRS